MTGSALVASAVDPDVSASLQIYDRLKSLKDALGVANLSDSELQLFAMVAHHTGLDPFTKQIYAIKRGGRVTHQTGIDGYRSSAERTQQYAGSDESTYEECACGQADSPPQHPMIARVVVRRIRPDGAVIEQTGVARWHELKPDHRKPQNGGDWLDAMWWKQPYNQLAKCAEANGLRKAFPRVLGGVYITDEMQQAPVIEGSATEVGGAHAKPNPSARERIAARRQAVEQPAAAVDSDDETIEGSATEIVEPAWMAGAVATEPPAEAPTTAAPADDVDVADVIRDSAEASGMAGPATVPQQERLRALLGGLNGTGDVPAALAFLWGDATDLTAARAQALVNQADSVGDEAFVAAFRELARRARAAAA